MLENTVVLSNKLEIKIDWLSFTFLDLKMPADLINMLGFFEKDFSLMPKGSNGYKSMLKLSGYPLYIMFDGNEDMGIFVSCSGGAIHALINAFSTTLEIVTPFDDIVINVNDFKNNVMIELLIFIKRFGHIARLDIAIDDIGCRFYKVQQVHNLLINKQCVSKFRNYQNLSKHSISTGDYFGHTIYMGSRSSNIMMRIYDKQMEMNSKLPDDKKINFPWVRWEFELKDERANEVANLIISRKNLGLITLGILKNYIRFVNLDDENRSRCSLTKTWKKFLLDVEPLRLYIPVAKKTIEQKKDWFIKQVMPTLSGIMISDYGSLDIVHHNIDYGISKMSKEMQDIVSNSNPDWKKDID